MLTELGRLALALGALFAAWAAIVGALAIRHGRADFTESSRRALAAAAGCAGFALVAILAALLGGDTRVAFVADHASVLMPALFSVSALLSDPGGALPAFAAIVGAIAILSTGRGEEPARRWTTLLAGGTIAVSLGLGAQFDPLQSRIARGDGMGLAPELQHGAAVLQAVALLVGSGLSFGAFAQGASALATRTLGDTWSRAIRPWNALTFVALSAGLVASACGSAAYPVAEPWLAQRTTTVWLFAVIVSAWLVQLDRARQGPERAVMRLLLTAAVFTAATAAVALTGGGFIRPAMSAATQQAFLFGCVPAGAMAATISFLRRGKGALADARGVTNEPANRVALAVCIIGLIVLAGAAGGSVATRSHSAQLADTEILRVRDPFGTPWSFKSQGVSTLRRENFASYTVALLPDRDGTQLALMPAEARSYLLATDEDAAPPVAVTAIRHAFLMDVRVTIDQPDAKRPSLRVRFVPLASWLWPGALLLWVGVLLHVVPAPRKAA